MKAADGESFRLISRSWARDIVGITYVSLWKPYRFPFPAGNEETAKSAHALFFQTADEELCEVCVRVQTEYEL
jgi:hypothetical protein